MSAAARRARERPRLASTGGTETTTRAKTLRLAGVLSEESGLYERAEKLHEQGLALYRRLGNRGGVAASLTSLGSLAYAVGDLELGMLLTQANAAFGRDVAGSRMAAWAMSQALPALMRRADGRVLAAACALERAAEEEARRWREDEQVTLRGRSEATRLAIPA